MINVTVLGASGYAGMALLRILASHPEVGRVYASSRSFAGKPIAESDPGIASFALDGGRIAPVVRSPHEAVDDPGDVVFSALPHGASAELCAAVFGKALVIDLSADFRFKDALRYKSAYGSDPPQPEVQTHAVYGLCERNRSALRNARVIANPGCYPTATLLPLLPVLPFVPTHTPIVTNAISGISGAGKKEQLNLLFAERSENANAYNPGRLHRHAAEISEQIQRDTLVFTPHLVPIKQGMLVTTTVFTDDMDQAIAARDSLHRVYRDEPFISFTGQTPPETRHVRGTNQVRIATHVSDNTLILMSAIDNLWKGAAGQAVQNMNIRFGFPETTGLLRQADL